MQMEKRQFFQRNGNQKGNFKEEPGNELRQIARLT